MLEWTIHKKISALLKQAKGINLKVLKEFKKLNPKKIWCPGYITLMALIREQ